MARHLSTAPSTVCPRTRRKPVRRFRKTRVLWALRLPQYERESGSPVQEDASFQAKEVEHDDKNCFCSRFGNYRKILYVA